MTNTFKADIILGVLSRGDGMVDMKVSKTFDRKVMRVRLSPAALKFIQLQRTDNLDVGLVMDSYRMLLRR